MRLKGIITIEKNGESKKYPFGVDFTGHNEGSSIPCKDETEVKKEIQDLIKEHNHEYDLKIIDNRITQTKLK